MRIALDIYVDGGCSGNPGEGSIGVVISRDGKLLKEISKTIGETTNNVAEYMAMIYALQEALILKADTVKVHTDSELMHRQLIGEYKVKNQTLKLLFDQVAHLRGGFQNCEITRVPRERNQDADRLAKQALKKQAKMVAPLFEYSGEESPSSKG